VRYEGRRLIRLCIYERFGSDLDQSWSAHSPDEARPTYLRWLTITLHNTRVLNQGAKIFAEEILQNSPVGFLHVCYDVVPRFSGPSKY